jgi:hypothetical protein
MDHRYIEENQIADRYVMRQLDAGEQAGFEEHFLDCPECLDRIEVARAMRNAMRDMAAVPRRRSWLNLVAAAAALILLAPSALLLLHVSALRRDLDGARKEAAGWKNSLEEAKRRPAPDWLPVSRLELVRDPTAGTETPNRILASSAAEARILVFETEADPSVQACRVRLLVAGGETWQSPSFPRDSLGVVVPQGVIVHRREPYEAILEGLTSSGRWVTVGRFRFRTALRN